MNKLGESGIYSVLDCHQDLMSPKFCGITMMFVIIIDE